MYLQINCVILAVIKQSQRDLDGSHRNRLDSSPVSTKIARRKFSFNIFYLFLSLVPSQPPHSVIVRVLSSQSMEVTWSKPPTNVINGKLLGYRVYYYSTKNRDQVFNRTVTKPDERNVTLTGLHKFTSYRVKVVAFTRVGEGVASLPKGGITLEDSKCDRNVLWASVVQTVSMLFSMSLRQSLCSRFLTCAKCIYLTNKEA